MGDMRNNEKSGGLESVRELLTYRDMYPYGEEILRKIGGEMREKKNA